MSESSEAAVFVSMLAALGYGVGFIDAWIDRKRTVAAICIAGLLLLPGVAVILAHYLALVGRFLP